MFFTALPPALVMLPATYNAGPVPSSNTAIVEMLALVPAPSAGG